MAWNVDFGDCCGVVSDTAANMNLFGKILEDGYDIPHHYCIDHILQLTAKLALKYDTKKKALWDNCEIEAL
jgi:hypothetical protein